MKNSRKEAINQGSMNMTRSPSGLGGPLLNINKVDQRRNSSLSFYNAGPAASTPALNNIADVRHGMPPQVQPQMAMGMQQQMYSTNPLLEQAQMLNYQTAQIANMMSMTMGLPMALTQPPMVPMSMNPGMGNFASTPNLLAGPVTMNPYMQQPGIQSPGLMGPVAAAPLMSPPIMHPPMMTGQVQGGMPDGFIDDGKKQRIDQWRMSVHMEP
jgi:hypothetical protein